MIDKMSGYTFIMLEGDRNGFIETLAGLGVVDIRRSGKAADAGSLALLDRIAEKKARYEAIRSGKDAELDALRLREKEAEGLVSEALPWGDWDRKKLEATGVKIRFHCIKEKDFKDEWEKTYPLAMAQKSEGRIWFVSLDSPDFPVKDIAAPRLSLSEAKAQLEEIRRQINEKLRQMEALKPELPALRGEIEELEGELRLSLASAAGKSAAEDTLVCFEGFAPVEEDAKLEQAFDALPCFWMREEAKEADNPPIRLKNNRFARLFEPLTGMYGMPVYAEFDPTPVLAPFFLLFFALCMGDAGYGLVLILFGIAVNRKWVRIDMFKNIGTLISVLGCATFVVGLLLGTFFGINLYEQDFVPQWWKELMIADDKKIAGYSSQMVLAIGIGVFHICLAMFIKAILFTKRFGIKKTINTWGWLILIIGALTTAALSLFAGIDANTVKWLIIAIGGISALAIFIFNKPGRNPLVNIGAGLWDSYQTLTGLLGDVLSYIRLYALGLAGGMLGAAFNDLGVMILGDNPTWQWLPFILVLLFGHVLNLLMSCLGAFVHPLRLTFVEYFKNAGYEGKGVKYNPVRR